MSRDELLAIVERVYKLHVRQVIDEQEAIDKVSRDCRVTTAVARALLFMS